MQSYFTLLLVNPAFPFPPIGKPDKVPQARNYSHFIHTKDLKMAYQSVVIPGNDSGLHIEIIPQNPDDKYQVK